MQAIQMQEANSTSGISAFWLKIIAVTGMFLQHLAIAMPGAFPFGFEVFLQISGGLTMPIMAFLLVEGFHATSNLDKYMLRVAIFAAVSFIPHLFVLGSGYNIMFTLLVGLFLLSLRREYGNSAKFWLSFIGMTLVTFIFDWGIIGPVSIILYDIIKNEKKRRIAVPIFFAVSALGYSMLLNTIFGAILSPFVDMEALAGDKTIASAFFPLGSLIAIPLLLMYKNKRGRPAKWFFYVFYPAHLVVIAVISIALGRNIVINMIRDLIYEFGQFF